MDENKLKLLKECGYKIKKCCIICEHIRVSYPIYSWATCKKNKYLHKKHTDNEKEMSVFIFGCCEDGFELKNEAKLYLKDWEQFIEN